MDAEESRRWVLGLVGIETWRERPQRSALYRRRSRWVAFISTPWGDSTFGQTFPTASFEYAGGMVMRTSYRALFMARMLSVVQAIQPQPGSSLISEFSEPGVAAAALEARRSSSRSGMSWTPMEKRGRSLCGGAVDARRSLTARGMFERMERSYTVKES
jgi:hypothetical protein